VRIFGFGILRGLGITFRHFVESYREDYLWRGRRYFHAEGIARRQSKEVRGIFTVQYPEEKLPVPEAFRMLPFLIYEEGDAGTQNLRCTACGICARVCPPQCIWIVRATEASSGRPVAAPAEFHIDIDRCMNCGYCAEYCPFDAIRMDRKYELASRNRAGSLYNLKKLEKPLAYHAFIHPAAFAREQAVQAKRRSLRNKDA
jgi:NADH-quinone oxidoreductase subunit I